MEFLKMSWLLRLGEAMRNKRAQMGKQVMIFSFLLLMVIIGVGITLGVGIYFGTGYDARQADANVLAYKISNCFGNNSISDIQSKFYATCGIDEKSLENNQIIMKICESLNVEDCAKDSATAFLFSGSNFQACVFSGGQGNVAFPRCSSSTVSKDGRSFTIIAGSNQQIKRINDNG